MASLSKCDLTMMEEEEEGDEDVCTAASDVKEEVEARSLVDTRLKPLGRFFHFGLILEQDFNSDK
jgi:hypothetical protein